MDMAKNFSMFYVMQAGTEHSLRALKGDVSTDSEDWLGTIIRSSK
jgi:hypothetical protein